MGSTKYLTLSQDVYSWLKKLYQKKVTRAVAAYLQVLKEDKLPIDKVIVFGSYAKGTYHQWSDIDVCIISPKFNDAWKVLHYLWARRLSDSNPAIEPVGFNRRDFSDDTDSLIYEIKKMAWNYLSVKRQC